MSTQRDLSKMEMEKEILKKQINSPSMTIGMLFTWLFLTFIIACMLWYAGYGVFGNDALGICMPLIGMGAFAAVIGLAIKFGQNNNKPALEDKLRKIESEIAMYKGEKSLPTDTSPEKNINAKNKNNEYQSPKNTEDLEKELRRIKKLLDDNLITEEEYQDLRKKIMKSQ